MKTVVLLLATFFVCSIISAQTIESVFSIESRAGYSTNTLLHPIIDEWDTTDDGAFARIIPSGHLFLSASNVTFEVSGGVLFETVLDTRGDWSGVFGSGEVRYEFLSTLSAGLQVNGSGFTSEYDKQSFLIIPDITWTPTLSTRLRARGGSSFRKYGGVGENGEIDYNTRFDLYGIELEHWPSMKWRVVGTAFGLMSESLPENHSVSLSLSRLIRQRSGLTLNISMNKYTNSFLVSPEGGTNLGPGQPINANGEYIDQTDRALRTAVNYSFPVTGRLSGSASVAQNTFWAGNGEYRSDIAVIAGIRYSISGRDLLNRNRNDFEPTWDQRNNDAVVVNVRYGGSGRLYLTGDFNGWEKPGIALSKQNKQRYAAKLDLDAGIYEYKVLLLKGDEITWIELSDEAMTVKDGFGGTNGLIFIEE